MTVRDAPRLSVNGERSKGCMAKQDSGESSFEVNYKRLEQLALELQENKIGIDALVPRMKEALAAIKVCKEVLRETKLQLKELSSEFAEVGVEDPQQQ